MRHLRTQGRQKALFGLDGAASGAIIGAAITTGASLIGDMLRKNDTLKAAQMQADAARAGAKQQADALTAQTEANERLQTRSMELNKELARESKEEQERANLSLQLMAGNNDMQNYKKSAKIVAKRGGYVGSPLLRGGYNMPFKVTDGGGVIPLGKTRQGFDLYELFGNDHDHYHKTNGKAKSGVGIKLANGRIVEGEGNQNTNRGEKLLMTPDSALFISKHSIKGFNPAKAVDAGLDPLKAFVIQEQLKKMYNIPNNGKKKHIGGITPVNSFIPGVNVPAFIVGANNSTPVEEDAQQYRNGGARRLRNGGKVSRCKARVGQAFNVLPESQKQYNPYGDYIAAGINVLGALGSTLISNRANTKAASILNSGYTDAAKYLSDAYGSLKTIDPSIINESDYSVGQAMANTSAAIVGINPQIEKVERDKREQLRGTRNLMSSAARLNQAASIIDRAQQIKSQVYADQANKEAEIGRQNLAEINATERLNAQLRSRSREGYNNARLQLAQYNNNIENQKILGAASAMADMTTSIAANNANRRLINANNWSDVFNVAGGNFGNAVYRDFVTRNELFNEHKTNENNGGVQGNRVLDNRPSTRTTSQPVNYTDQEYLSGAVQDINLLQQKALEFLRKGDFLSYNAMMARINTLTKTN